MLKPEQIKEQKFGKGLFGCKTSEVDSFVQYVYRAYDELYRENSRLSEELNKANELVKESRMKIFNLENDLQKVEGTASVDSADAKKKADDIIKKAEAQAAAIIAKAKEQGEKLENTVVGKNVEEKKADTKTETKPESGSAKFFKKAVEEQTASSSDDDEIFVGEIEDSRKPDRMMIGDGEEEEDMDFEFV